MANIPVQVVISAVDNASKTFKNIGKGISQQSVDWAKLSLAVSGATIAMGTAITKFARDASKTDAVRSAFGAMTKGVIEDSNDFLRAVKVASAGTLSEYDILKIIFFKTRIRKKMFSILFWRKIMLKN